MEFQDVLRHRRMVRTFESRSVGMVLGYGSEPPRARPWRPVREIIHLDRYTPAYDWTPRRLPPRTGGTP